METLNALLDNFMRDAHDDYLGLWAIAWHFRNDLGIEADSEVKEKTLSVVRGIMERGVMPGNLAETGGFIFWQGTPSELLTRVEAEWPENGIPRLDYSACWFALRKPNEAGKHEDFMPLRADEALRKSWQDWVNGLTKPENIKR